MRYILIIFLLTIINYPAFLFSENFKKLVSIERNNLIIAELNLEIADEEDEKIRGLMWRTDLKNNEGMLFKWNNSKIRSFWMKNTPLSLDIIFINEENTISEVVYSAIPFSLEVIRSNYPSMYVIEILGGKSKEFQINVGDQVNFDY